MSDLKRAQKSGNFYRRAAKYMVLDPSEKDRHDAGSSTSNPLTLSVENVGSEASISEANMPQTVDIIDCDADDHFLDDEDADSIDSDAEINVGDPISQTLENMSIIDGLRYWALTTNAPHSSINIVLKLFKKVQVDVPANAKTLLRTKRNTSLEIAEIGGGQLWYCGFEKCLINYFCVNKCPTNKLSLSVSIDGLPLHNSSSMQFWPILFTVQELPQAPVMMAGIFCGPTKPTNLEQYLRPMVEELNWLFTSGITIRGQQVTVKLRVIVADTLARSFIKGVVSHNSYEGCLKCTVEGTYIHEAHTMAFLGINATKRTDKDFRDGIYPGHRKIPTPLLDLPEFDIIEDVVVGDPLHILHQGIMKRLLIGWRDGVMGRIRWSDKDCEDISVALGKIALPSEIHREIRPLKFLKYWKASECATILHYAAIVVFEPYLPEDIYQHFMLLFCGITLLSSSVHKDHWPLAGRLLDRFVLEYSDIYGERYVNSNVHNVQHIYEEVQRFGSISSLSTYPYESKLHHLKRLIRSGWKNLEQAVNRLSELDEFFASRAPSMIKFPSIARKDTITTVHVRPNFIIQNNPRNCWFLTKDENIVQFHTAKEELGGVTTNVCLSGQKLNLKDLAFDDPMDSSIIFIFKGYMNSLSSSLIEANLNDIRCKLVPLQINCNDEFIFIPLLHTLSA